MIYLMTFVFIFMIYLVTFVFLMIYLMIFVFIFIIYLLTFVFIFMIYLMTFVFFMIYLMIFFIYFYDLFNDAYNSSVQGYTDPGRLNFCPVVTDNFGGPQYGTCFMTAIWRVKF